MKKRIIFVLTAAMLFFSQVMISSCSKEENDEPSKQNNSGKDNGTNNNQQTVKEDSQYTVSYSSDFGVAPQSLTVKEGDKLTSGDLKPLDTDGYIFLGWYNGSNQVEEGFVVKQDLKLVAKWTKDGVVYANELKEFLAKKTDDSKVYDVTISDLNPDMDVVVKALKDNPKIKVNLNLENCTELKDLKIMPDGGISKSKAESFLVNLVSLTLPNGVVNIVLGCDGLTSINIPNSVTTIEIYTETPPTIRNANAINPDCKIFVEKECVDAFKNADGWNQFASNIKILGCNYLYAGELNDWLSKQADESKIYDVCILDLNPDMDVILKSLGNHRSIKVNLDLESCTELKEINIGSQDAFRKPKLSEDFDIGVARSYPIISLKLPNSVIKLGISRCKLKFLSLSNKIESLYIEECEHITYLDLPHSIKQLDLRSLNINTLNIPNSVTDLWLENLNELTSLVLPPSLQTIWMSGLTQLDPLTIPNGVRELYMKDCTPNNIPTFVQNLQLHNNITSLEIPSTVTELGLWCCNDLRTIRLHCSEPPTLDYELNTSCKIYVPYDLDIYRNADGWSKYANQIEQFIGGLD